MSAGRRDVVLVGGPKDGTRFGFASPLAPTLDVDGGTYRLDPAGQELREHDRYVYVPPSGGMRGQCSCTCGQAGCPNYGVDA